MNKNMIDYEELLRLYRNADNKAEEIQILAELTASDAETIIEVLKDHNAFNPEDVKDNLRTCSRCGRKYIAATLRGRATCSLCVYTNRRNYYRERVKKQGKK